MKYWIILFILSLVPQFGCSGSGDEKVSNPEETPRENTDEKGGDEKADIPRSLAQSCDGTAPTVTGTLQTGVTDVEFRSVAIDVVHRRDVDPEDGGCLTNVKIALSNLDEVQLGLRNRVVPGCRLEVYALGQLDSTLSMPIVSADFGADSDCPGFTDSQEGRWLTETQSTDPYQDGYEPVGFIRLPASHVQERQAERTCFNGTFEIHLDGTIDGFEIGPSVLTVRGDVNSRGNEEAQCPCAVTPELQCRTDESGEVAVHRVHQMTSCGSYGPPQKTCGQKEFCAEGGDPVTDVYTGEVEDSDPTHHGPYPVAAGSVFEATVTGERGLNVYVRFDEAPTKDRFDCESDQNGRCTLTVPAHATTAHAMVFADYSTRTNYKLTVDSVAPAGATAGCACTNAWSGANCDVCAGNWDEEQDCAECRNGWRGENCEICPLGWDEASDCGTCAEGWSGDDCQRRMLDDIRYSSVIAAGDGLLTTQSRTLSALDLDGGFRWYHRFERKVGMPLVVNNIVYAPFTGGWDSQISVGDYSFGVVAFSLTGEHLWHRPLGNDRFITPEISAAPDGNIIVDWEDEVRRLDGATGQTLSVIELPFPIAQLSVRPDGKGVARARGDLYLLDFDTQSWTYLTQRGYIRDFVIDRESQVFFVDEDALWRADAQPPHAVREVYGGAGGSESLVLGVDGQIYVAANFWYVFLTRVNPLEGGDVEFTALKWHNGPDRSRDSCPKPRVSVGADGRVYVACDGYRGVWVTRDIGGALVNEGELWMGDDHTGAPMLLMPDGLLYTASESGLVALRGSVGGFADTPWPWDWATIGGTRTPRP